MRSLLTAILGVTLVCSAVGCADAPSVDDADADAWGESTSQLTGCSITRAQILASASPKRREAVERGFEWLDADVPYSQSRSHEGYRTDCSGFVSMCWDMGRSSNTSSFYSGDANSRLGGFDDLVVADALVKQGHIVLFLGWNDAAKTGACVLEQASTASDMQFRVRTRASLQSSGYKAIRAKSLAGETGPVSSPPILERPPVQTTPTKPTTPTSPTQPETPEDEDSDLDIDIIVDRDTDRDTDSDDTSSVSTQSSEVGDSGDPDEENGDYEEEEGSTPRKRRRASTDLASSGCSAAPGGTGQLMGWSPVLGVLLVLARRRRKTA